MRRLLSFFLLTCLTPILSLAQTICPSWDTLINETVTDCETLDPNTLCLVSDTIDITSDSDETSLLSEISVIDATSDAEDTASFILRLNRDDQVVQILGIGNLTLSNTAPRTQITVTATRNVNLRQMPSVDASAIGSLTIRENYTAIGRLSDNTWVQIRLEDGRIGWASAQYFITREGYEALQTVTPSAPPYLPMQAFEFTAEECATLLLIAPEITEPDAESIIFSINGVQITVRGILSLTIQEDTLILTNIIGEHLVNTFGFETDLTSQQRTTIPLSDSGTIAGIATEPETTETLLSDEIIELLFPTE